MNAGKLNFGISLDLESLKRQLAATGREAAKSGKSSGAGWGNAFRTGNNLNTGLEREFRSTLPHAANAGSKAGVRYKDAFGRNCKPEVAVRVDYGNAERQGSQFADNLKGKFSGLGSSFESILAGASAAVASSILNLVGGAISTVTQGIKTLVGEVYKVGTAAEYNQVSLTAMVGSADKAAKLVSDIQKFSAATPFTSGQLVGATKGLLATVELKDMVGVLKQIGNAAAVAKKEGQDLGVAYNEVAAIYGKINNKGKVTAEEMNQLTERGIVLQKEIAAVMGVQVEELADLMEKGKVTDAIFNQAFKTFTTGGGLATGQMDALSNTTEGLLSTLQEGLEQAGVQIFKLIQPALNEVIKQITTSTAEVGKTSTAMTDLGKITNKWTEYLKANPEIIEKLTELAVKLLDDGMKQLVKESDKLLQYLKQNPDWIEKAITSAKGFFDQVSAVATVVSDLVKLFGDVYNFLTKMNDQALKFMETVGKIGDLKDVFGLGQALGISDEGSYNQQAGKYTVYSEGSTISGAGQLDPHHGGGDEFRKGTKNRKRDIVLAQGANQSVPVPSPLSGTVTTSAYEKGGAGHYVIVKSMDGLTATLMHFSKTLVKEGQKVNYGDTLGIQGNTGRSTGTHLHGEMEDKVWSKYIKSLTTGVWGKPKLVNKVVEGIANAWTGGSSSPAGRREGFLAAIRYGESDGAGGYQAVNKSSGARGAYQFMPPTRNAIKNKYGTDAYGNQGQQDASALNLIRDEGKRLGKDILGMIDNGNFRDAASHLRSQWTSLPGAREQSAKWKNRSIDEFKNPNGRGGGLDNYNPNADGRGGGLDTQAIKNENALQALKIKHDQERAALARKQAEQLRVFMEKDPSKGELKEFNKKQSFQKNELAIKQKNQLTSLQAKQGDTAEIQALTAKQKAQAAAIEAKIKAGEELTEADLKLRTDLKEKADKLAEETQHIHDEVKEGLEHSSEGLHDAQTQLERISQGKSSVDPEIQNIKDTFENYRENITKMISDERELLEKATDPNQRNQIAGNIKSLDTLISLSQQNEKSAIQARQQALMMEETKKAEADLAEARAKRIEDERAYNEALFSYLAEQKQKGEIIKAAIKRTSEEKYEKNKQSALDQGSLLSSQAQVLEARASTTTDINAKAGLQREAGLLNIQADVTGQLSAIDDLERSGRFANSQIETLRNNVLEIGQIRIDGLKDQFQDLGGVLSQELQGAVGNFLTAVLTGTQTAGEALRGLVNQLLSALANLAIKQLLGGLFGGGAGSVLGLASGTGLGNVGQAMQKEHTQSGGRKPIMAVLNQDEVVLSAQQAKQYRSMMSKPMLNFAMGTSPNLPTTSASIGNTNVNIPITVNGDKGKGSGLNTPEFKREVEASVTAIILKHQTSSGGLLRK